MNTLLIVEDEKMIRQGIKAIALRSEVPINNIIECKNGQEALEIIESQIVDVMITDVRMPKVDGIELVKAMQSCTHIPLTVAVSGYDDFAYAVELLRYGIKEYILKPVDRVQITNILMKLEKEIQIMKENQFRILNIGYQQLKYLMLNDDISNKETEVIMKQFEHIFFDGDYVVCCTNYDKEGFPELEGVTYLKDVDKQGIFIVEQTKLEELLNEELLNYSVGVSNQNQGLKNLKKAYIEAFQARKLAFLKCEHKVVFENMEDKIADPFTDNNDDRMDSDYNYKEKTMDRGLEKLSKKDNIIISDQDISQIVQLIGTNKISEVLKMIEHIQYRAKILDTNPDLFAEQMNQLMEQVIATYKNAIDIDSSDTISYKGMYTYSTIVEFCQQMKEWFEKINRKLLMEFEDYHNKLKIQKAVVFINENYNRDLNMAVVSNHISMNYSLFSYAFKQYTGCNFVNYMKKIRITEAKKLLEKTDMRITDIALAIGYENDKHFMKTFKSICGVSPTEYRKNCNLSNAV